MGCFLVILVLDLRLTQIPTDILSCQAADQLRQLLHRLGSAFVQKLVYEMAKATIHYRFQARVR
jgi:hypothetical protein